MSNRLTKVLKEIKQIQFTICLKNSVFLNDNFKFPLSTLSNSLNSTYSSFSYKYNSFCGRQCFYSTSEVQPVQTEISIDQNAFNEDILKKLENASYNSETIRTDYNSENVFEGILNDEIKDPEIIFKSLIKKLESKYGRENMVFPKEIYFLLGAPGSGKSSMSTVIMRDRGLTSSPVIVSDLLDTSEMQKMKDNGLLIGDRIVVEMVLEKLLDKQYATGVIVDGFPRTTVQAQIVSMLYDYMMELRTEFMNKNQSTPVAFKFRRPVFRIIVLYVDEEVSIQRQLARGRKIMERNRQFEETGHGQFEKIRKTDISIDAARKRYKFFANNVFESLQTLKVKFPYNFIDASGSVEQVEKKMHKEFEYQSSLELGPDTYLSLSEIIPAEKLTEHARQYLVQRLDRYQMRHTALFKKVINIIKTKFMHILERQALSGVAIIRSEDPIFEDPLALNILLDVLTERGYQVILDYEKKTIPVKSADDKEIYYKIQRTFHFEIRFKRPEIRSVGLH